MRSLLFVPGMKSERLPKALDSGADMICLDLEDSVSSGEKASARELAEPLLRADRQLFKSAVGLRINALNTLAGLQDIQFLAEKSSRPDFLMIPKCESVEMLTMLDQL